MSSISSIYPPPSTQQLKDGIEKLPAEAKANIAAFVVKDILENHSDWNNRKTGRAIIDLTRDWKSPHAYALSNMIHALVRSPKISGKLIKKLFERVNPSKTDVNTSFENALLKKDRHDSTPITLLGERGRWKVIESLKKMTNLSDKLKNLIHAQVGQAAAVKARGKLIYKPTLTAMTSDQTLEQLDDQAPDQLRPRTLSERMHMLHTYAMQYRAGGTMAQDAPNDPIYRQTALALIKKQGPAVINAEFALPTNSGTEKESVFQRVANQGNLPMFKLLLQHGGNVHAKRSTDRATLVHRVVSDRPEKFVPRDLNQQEVMDVNSVLKILEILKKEGVDIHARDTHGNKAIDCDSMWMQTDQEIPKRVQNFIRQWMEERPEATT
jgi:hypothetical protein